jgi:hypothetical protein
MRRELDGHRSRWDDEGVRHRDLATYIEYVFIDRDFYVHAVTDVENTVQVYSVTSRTRRFRPKFRPPGGSSETRARWLRNLGFHYRFRPQTEVTLCKTRFAALETPQAAAGWVGAHNWHYFEAFSYGNPGNYQTFVYSINDAGPLVGHPRMADMNDFATGYPEAGANRDLNELAEFRRNARINTYSVVGPDFVVDDYPSSEGRLDEYPTRFGVSSYYVRTLGD